MDSKQSQAGPCSAVFWLALLCVEEISSAEGSGCKALRMLIQNLMCVLLREGNQTCQKSWPRGYGPSRIDCSDQLIGDLGTQITNVSVHNLLLDRLD